MIAILAEARSDFDTLRVLVRRIIADKSLTIAGKGYTSCDELCRKGGGLVTSFMQRGFSRFVICHDSDNNDSLAIVTKIRNAITRPSGSCSLSCIIVPVQEIEAWILADEMAVRTTIPTFQLCETLHPENVQSPKEYIERASRSGRTSPLYSHAIHNPKVAAHLDIAKVSRKCPSFRHLVQSVVAWRPSTPAPVVELHQRWGGIIYSPDDSAIVRAIDDLQYPDDDHPSCALVCAGAYRIEIHHKCYILIDLQNDDGTRVNARSPQYELADIKRIVIELRRGLRASDLWRTWEMS
ncbi:MAG: DUF4276 family protein [Phycisphaeraceae bacterium]|nr:DUF4276 family protein [Phycisphaeraceae bacterium]